MNQIAAGEVIERPASVVKELLENSLDAGASDIHIDIEHGGTRLIRIRDNGHGIHADDLTLAVDSHTTSKLLDADGLWHITTLGFRGEALSSIASVSRFTLTSRQSTDKHGHTLIIDGAMMPVKPAPHPVGTTIEVRDLFYNTPARRKFLRSERTEFIHIHELVKRLAMGRYDVSFHLTHNGKPVMNLLNAGRGPEVRLTALYGKTFIMQAQYVDQAHGDMRLWGWIGLPETARSQNDQQYFYLNSRSIRDKLVSHAVRLACQDGFPAGRYPVYLLYLEMNTEMFDINVHPAKQDVRFRDVRMVHDFIYGSISRAMNFRAPIEEKSVPRLFKQDIHIREDTTDYLRKIYSIHNHSAADQKQDIYIPVAGRYLVAERDNKLLLVDVYRAREFITLQRLRESLKHGVIPRRPILVPLGITLTETEMQLLEAERILLEQLGLELQPVGPLRIMIRSVPALLAGADAAELVRDVIRVISVQKISGNLTDNLLETFSAHANDSVSTLLSHAEAAELLNDLFRLGGDTTELNNLRRYLDPEALKALLNSK